MPSRLGMRGRRRRRWRLLVVEDLAVSKPETNVFSGKRLGK
jgi:hypothetical protein